MKTFKSYLKEAPAWTESLSDMLFDLPRAGLVDVKIPLSPSIFKRIWPKPVRSTVFHLTNDEGVRGLKKMEGGKKSISAFYNIKTAAIQDGIMTDGGYVVEMDADVLAAAPDDIGTQPDKTGRRWLVLDTLTKTMGGASKLKGMEKDIEKMLTNLIIKYSDNMTMTDINQAWESLRKEYKNDGKTLSLIIKDYIDGTEAIMKKYSKPLKSIFFDYAFDKELVPDPDSGDLALWDEIVVNNFKVKKVHVSAEFSPDFKTDSIWDDDPLTNSDFGWTVPFKLYDDDKDLVDYIDKTRN
jgi:uncharacterized protein YihD (DUF1040 family)